MHLAIAIAILFKGAKISAAAKADFERWKSDVEKAKENELNAAEAELKKL